jgi:TRAP-type C4-dicarboxylate transport system permease small subunit
VTILEGILSPAVARALAVELAVSAVAFSRAAIWGSVSRMPTCLTFVSTALLPKRFPYVVARIHSCIAILYCYLTGLIKASTRVDGGWFRCGGYARSTENTAPSLA